MENYKQSKDFLFVSDPNSLNLQYNKDGNVFTNAIPNGIPRYEDMNIFAELLAIRKGRTTILTGGGAVNDDEVKVNFIGVNQNTNSPNYLNFTTNYYDDSTHKNETQFESFGISNIKILVNSSYVPQINIQFVDVRGLSFFNQDNSPYRILFDFPPPIFKLTVKGYYGSTLEYELHLVKYTTEFKSENGNFIIDCQFVASTFAPLSDILLKYIINAPLITWNYDAINSNPEERPVNTYDLIMKLRNMYTNVKNDVNIKTESEKYDNGLIKISGCDDAFKVLGNYNDYIKSYVPLIYVYDNNDKFDDEDGQNFSTVKRNVYNNMTILRSISDYDSIIQSFKNTSVPSEIKTRLFVGMVYIDGDNKQYSMLNDFRNVLNSSASKLGLKTNSIPDPIITYLFNMGNQGTYIGLDITNYYYSLVKFKNGIEDNLNKISISINTKINNSIEKYLGMRPTIYNIFEILLNDVDTFFNMLKKVSEAAYGHHNDDKNKSIIIGSQGFQDAVDSSKNVYSFPLVINNSSPSSPNNETRVAPIDLSNKCSTKFPEIEFVQNFIDTFAKQKANEAINDLRVKMNDDSNVWIPITPMDSYSVNNDTQSPYRGVNSFIGMLNVFIDRYYQLTQFSIPYIFYENNKLSKSIRTFYSSAEAINVMQSISTANVIENILTFSKLYEKDSAGFIDFLSKNVPNYEFINVFEINGAYLNRNDSSFIGASIVSDVNYQNIDSINNEKVKTFWSENTSGWFPASFNEYLFTSENLLYLPDSLVEDNKRNDGDMRNIDGVNMKTRYIADMSNVIVDDIVFNTSAEFGGNDKIKMEFVLNNPSNGFFDIIKNFKISLAKYDTYIYSEVLSQYSRLSSIIILSNFGGTLSFFNRKLFNRNTYFTKYPAIIEIPNFLFYYIGALIHAYDVDKNVYLQLYNFFNTGGGKYIENRGQLIFADIGDCIRYLSAHEKEMFLNLYYEFYDSQFPGIIDNLKKVSNAVMSSAKTYNEKVSQYDNYLNPEKPSSLYSYIIEDLITRKNLAVYSNLTFKMETNTLDEYLSLGFLQIKSDDVSNEMKKINSSFFTDFMSGLIEYLTKKNVIAEEEYVEQKKLSGDVDIINQMYYSFKNINDKWLSSTVDNSFGYPYNVNGRRLIDSFAFVDRTMNAIGDTIINPEILLDMFNDANISLFSAISQLLSLNNFIFFPLQNFMSYEGRDSWNNCFKINTSTRVNNVSAFVCMYIGGTASHLTNSKNGYLSDGIDDIESAPSDFTVQQTKPNYSDDKQLDNNNIFPYGQVRAFRVRFAEQNQSMFTNIKIDSKEFPETNESIQILSKLVGDEKDKAPISKSQNLYNLYENRAYSATIDGLGNATIQPTQYFQLDNVPLYNGAYLIISVEHDITPNKMTTSFTGTKILKYPVPRVLNTAVAMGFEGSFSEKSIGEVVSRVSSDASYNPNMAKYNSMYNTNIQ